MDGIQYPHVDAPPERWQVGSSCDFTQVLEVNDSKGGQEENNDDLGEVA